MTDSLATSAAVPRSHMATGGKTAFRVSRWLHKYVGLVLVLFLMWMSLSGRLFFDLAGMTLFYLSLSAFYVWYYPKRVIAGRRRRRGRPPRWMGRLFRFIHRYHLKLGIWSAAVLLVPVGSLLFFLITVSGVYDWVYHRIRGAHRAAQSGQSHH